MQYARFLGCLISCWSISHVQAESLTWDAAKLWSQAVTSDLRLNADHQELQLVVGEVIEDDGPAAGYTYQPSEEKLSEQIWAKKILEVPQPQAVRAWLLIMPGGDLKVSINGKPAELNSEGKVGNYWTSYSFNPELLQQGTNEFVFSGNCKLGIARNEDFAAGSATRPRHPNRSLKSRDGGKTWDDQRLGTKDNLDGEYNVRLYLQHFLPQGLVESPVFDSGDLNAVHVLHRPIKALSPVQFQLDVRQPAGTAVTFEVRSGSTYYYNEKTWDLWTRLEPNDKHQFHYEKPQGRFVQFRVQLASTLQQESPCLRSVSINCEPQRAEDWTSAWQVTNAINPHIVKASHKFEYEPLDHPDLSKLRKEHGLDEVVAGAKDEWEMMQRLAVWSATRWNTRGHLKEGFPQWNAADILAPHADGTAIGGFCLHFNLVLLQACESMGLSGRIVSIGPGNATDKIRGGHEVTEIWSNQFQKWVYLDGDTAWYFTDANSDVPLSLWELRQRQVAVFQGQPAAEPRCVRLIEKQEPWKGLAAWPPFLELRMVPRSNFLAQRYPVPLNQGMRGWFWTGHLVWSDDQLPARPLYPQRITQRSNFEWTLNQAHAVLVADPTPGVCHVHLDTQTPSFDTFLVSLDSGEAQRTPAQFSWKLHPGINRLEAVTLNTSGRRGIACQFEIKSLSP